MRNTIDLKWGKKNFFVLVERFLRIQGVDAIFYFVKFHAVLVILCFCKCSKYFECIRTFYFIISIGFCAKHILKLRSN